MQKSISTKMVSASRFKTLALAFLAGAATIFGASTLTSCEKDDPIKPPVDNPFNNKKQSETSKALVNMWKGLGIKFNTEKSDVAGAASGDITSMSYYNGSQDGIDYFDIDVTKSNQDSMVYNHISENPYNHQKLYGLMVYKFKFPFIEETFYFKNSINDPNPVVNGSLNLRPKVTGEVEGIRPSNGEVLQTTIPNTETSTKLVLNSGTEFDMTDVKIIQNK